MVLTGTHVLYLDLARQRVRWHFSLANLTSVSTTGADLAAGHASGVCSLTGLPAGLPSDVLHVCGADSGVTGATAGGTNHGAAAERRPGSFCVCRPRHVVSNPR